MNIGLELIAMADADDALRKKLAASGALFEDGYHADMRKLHEQNAARLDALLKDGWFSREMIGDRAADAAWLIVQHAISLPDFQRRCVKLIAAATVRGDVPGWQSATLEDRIRFFEGRPQLYGTQFDWREDGVLDTGDIEDVAHVDERRKAVGLEPLAIQKEKMRQRAANEGQRPPKDLAARNAKAAAWAKSCGWR